MLINQKNAHLININNDFTIKNAKTKEVKRVNRQQLLFICNKSIKDNTYKTWGQLIAALNAQGVRVII